MLAALLVDQIRVSIGGAVSVRSCPSAPGQARSPAKQRAQNLDPSRKREQNRNMPTACSLDARSLDVLRQRIRHLERPTAHHTRILPFGVEAIDRHLPERGLPLAALHEVSGGGADEGPAASAALFTAGILARLDHPVLWCSSGRDLFGPGLACAGLSPDRVLYAEATDDKTVLLVMEEALRHPGLAAVVGEVFRLPITASRRLVLAAEKSGVMAMALRRHHGRAEKTASPNAACTRWLISPLPSTPSPVGASGLGRARWTIDLTRCRGGTPKTWIMEACDAQGRLAVPAELGHGQAAYADQKRA